MVLPQQPERIVVFAAMFPPAYLGGGPIRTLDALVRSTPYGFETAVITADTDHDRIKPLDVIRNEWVDYPGNSRVYYTTSRSMRALWRAMRRVRAFKPDVVYVNSFFGFHYSIIPQLLARVRFFGRARVLLAPRGEFSASALSLKNKKKRIYLRIYLMLGLNRRVVWHASSNSEEDDIRSTVGKDAFVLVKEDDTDLKPIEFDPSEVRQPGPLRAATVARLVPIKRVDMLLTALSRVSQPLSLDIYGPAEDAAYSARCYALERSLPVHIKVAFHGEVEHADVPRILAEHDVMLMPTASENFGHVIAEALSASCPVVCADTTPWTQWLRAGGGEVVTPDLMHEWVKAIERFATLDSAQLIASRASAARTFRDWKTNRETVPHLFTLLGVTPLRPR